MESRVSGTCPICSQPWDESFMLCCDMCDRWCHGRCQGQFKNRKSRQWNCSLCSGQPYGQWQPPQRKINAIDDNLLPSAKEVSKKSVKNDTEVTANGNVSKMPVTPEHEPWSLSSAAEKTPEKKRNDSVTGTENPGKVQNKRAQQVKKVKVSRPAPDYSPSSFSSDFETPEKKRNNSVTGTENPEKAQSKRAQQVKKVKKVKVSRPAPDCSPSSFSSDFETPKKGTKK